MRHLIMVLSYISLLDILSQLAACATLNVTVGGPGSLAYDPEFVNAETGDTIRFIFQQWNHTVTQSTLGNPCQHVEGGFDTGFIPVADTVKDDFPVAQLTVVNNSPIWAYCAQGNHCRRGMVFAVNPGDDFSAFKSAAMGISAGTSSSSPPPPPTSPTPTSDPKQAPPPSPPSSSGPATSSMTAATPPAPAPSNPVAVVTVIATVTATQHPDTKAQPTPADVPAPLVNYKVTVGGQGSNQFAFQPSNLKANVGDLITFEFQQGNHTITASSFAKPCQSLSSTSQTGEVGFDSGFMPADDTAPSNFPTYTIRVNDTKAIWAYCRQADHCHRGMVFAVNALDDGPNTFEAFQALAEQSGSTSSSVHSSSDAATPNQRVTEVVVSIVVATIVTAFLL